MASEPRRDEGAIFAAGVEQGRKEILADTLAMLEALVGKSQTTEARKEWFDGGRQWLVVTWDEEDKQFCYFTREGEKTRADAETLLKGGE